MNVKPNLPLPFEPIAEDPAANTELVPLLPTTGSEQTEKAPAPGNWDDDVDAHGVEFRWEDALRDGSLVQRKSLQIAVYINPNDEVVIRQERDFNDEYDPIILVTPQNIKRLVSRLAELGERFPTEDLE
jgi:hypothetical protein